MTLEEMLNFIKDKGWIFSLTWTTDNDAVFSIGRPSWFTSGQMFELPTFYGVTIFDAVSDCYERVFIKADFVEIKGKL